MPGGGRAQVGLTPTYSGCPATEVIRASVRAALAAHDLGDAQLEEVLSPPWSSDWLSAAGRAKLTAFGIAPPATTVVDARAHLWHAPRIACPRCASLAHRAGERVRLDALQGTLPLHELRVSRSTTSSASEMLKFHPLKVLQCRPDAEDAIEIALEVPRSAAP